MLKWPSWVTNNTPDEFDHIVRCVMYQNTVDIGIAIVAVVSGYRQIANCPETWLPIDWAAYIGGSERGAKKELWAIQDTVRYGNKLGRKDARHFFPGLPMSMYRD